MNISKYELYKIVYIPKKSVDVIVVINFQFQFRNKLNDNICKQGYIIGEKNRQKHNEIYKYANICHILRHVNNILTCTLYMYRYMLLHVHVYTQASKGHNYYYTDKTFRYITTVCSYVNKHVTLFSLVYVTTCTMYSIYTGLKGT